MSDTTQTGVDDAVNDPQTGEGAPPPAERKLSPREERMAEIAARRAQDRAEEARTGEEMRSQEAGIEQPPEPAAQQPAASEGLPQTLKLKVDGNIVEITQDEALRRLQKDVAADQRLANATKILRDAQAQQAEVDRLHQELQNRLASVRALPETPQSAVDEEAIQNLVEALIDGRVDETKNGLKALVGRQQATPDVSQIAALVETNVRRSLAADRELEAKRNYDQQLVEGLNTFREKFPEIANDPRLFAYANAETDLIASENPGLSPAEIFVKAGERVSSMLQPSRQQQQTPQTRQGLKSLLERPVRGASGAVPLGEAPKPPATVSSVIAQMRKARGQM